MALKLLDIIPKVYAQDLDPELDVEIDTDELSKEFRLFAPIYWRYTMEQSYAQEKVADAKIGLKELRAKVYVGFKQDGVKRSEDFIDALVDLDPLVAAQAKQLALYEYELRNFEGYVQALKYKKDFLIQLGADARKEN